jgi:antibiotic biosynthesis monooxygenase (ABM) superfamily enzyme
MKQPKKWKMAILVWLVIYPTISLISFTLGGWLIQFSLLIRTLIMSLILVPFMIFAAMPTLNKVFKNWLIK